MLVDASMRSYEVANFVELVASKIADTLEVSLDFLIGKLKVEVDQLLLKRVIEVQQMEEEDKNHILYTLDALIKNVKLKSIA